MTKDLQSKGNEEHEKVSSPRATFVFTIVQFLDKAIRTDWARVLLKRQWAQMFIRGKRIGIANRTIIAK